MLMLEHVVLSDTSSSYLSSLTVDLLTHHWVWLLDGYDSAGALSPLARAAS